MFCKKCGKELPDEAVFCGDCGAEMKTAIPDAANVSEDAVITLNTEGQVPAGKKKKWLIPALVSGGIALVALVVAAIFLWPSPKGPTKDTQKTPVQDNADLNKEDIEGTLDSVGDSLNNWFNGNGGEIGYEGEIRLLINEELMSMISAETDVQWLSDISLAYDLSARDSLSKVALDLNLGDTEILSGEYIMDAESLEMWLLLPILSKKAIFYDLNAAMEQSGAMPSLMGGVAYGTMPSWGKLTDIVMTYIDMFLNSFSDVKEERETVEIEDISQELTVLKAEMTPKQFCKVMTDILEALKKDKELEQIIRDSLSFPDVEYDVYEDFLVTIDDAIQSLNEMMEEDDFPEDEVMCLYTYMDDNGNIVGRELSIHSDEGNRVGFSYITVLQDDEFGFELLILEKLRFAGSGEIDDKIDGTFIFSVEDEDFVELEYDDFDYDADYPTGTIRVTPLDAMINAMFENAELDSSAQMMLSMLEFSLEINISGTAQENQTSICLEAAGMNFATIEISGKVTDADEIEIPKDYVDAQNEEEMDAWAQELDQESFMETLMNRLAKAGVPEELLIAMGYSSEEIPL